MFLIVGLGNPGTKYEKTRHNLGHLVAMAFAQKHAFSLKKGWRVKGLIAKGAYKERRVAILLPTTYMNLSGGAVKKAVSYYDVPLEQLMIIADDVYLKFGALRLRKKGSSGGHNGLRSIEQELGTQEYPRLKMGIGEGKEQQLLEDFVLEPFNKDEMALLPEFIERGVTVLETWLNEGIDGAIQKSGKYHPL